MTNVRETFVLLALLFVTTSAAREQAPVKDSGRYSDAEKAYVAARATTRVAENPRQATLQVIIGRKFSPTPGDQLTITNGYLAPLAPTISRSRQTAAS